VLDRGPSQARYARDADRHALTFDDAGDPRGHPVLYFHGGGDSRLTRHPDDRIAESLGIRLLAVDRSGPAVPGRTLVTWARDVEAFADSLGLDKFAVVGWSAGGPHALAVAAVLPERVSQVVLVGSMPYPDRAGELARDVRLSLRAATLAPRFLARRLEAWGRRPTPPTGQADTDEAYARGRVESFRAGGMWLVQELAVLGRPWGFELSAVTAPATLWWGESDVVCPPSIARDYETRLPRATLKLVPGTHQVLFTRWREILADTGGIVDGSK
jgi:pimeloyl-ACP methyl ester carboxylesterase